MKEFELVKTQSQNLTKVVIDLSKAENKMNNKKNKTFKNLIKKQLKNLMDLDQINWVLSFYESHQGVVTPVLSKSGVEGNMFFNKSLDVMEAYYVGQLISTIQQASICGVELKSL